MQKDLRYVEYFLYTQQSLATFEKCPLKFKKRYLENLKWDSISDDIVERNLRMGNDFHMLANRYFLGIEVGTEHIVDIESDEELCELNTWIESLKEHFKMDDRYIYLPEHKLRFVSDDIKLEANFDLIVVKDDSLEIWDWKTRGKTQLTRGKASIQKYVESFQTKVYLFVLKELISQVTNKDIPIENIKMNYWQPQPPEILVSINYSQELHLKNRELIQEKIKRVCEYDYNMPFDKTSYSKECKVCEFNWFCNNEKMDLELAREEFLIDELDFDNIEERY